MMKVAFVYFLKMSKLRTISDEVFPYQVFFVFFFAKLQMRATKLLN